MGATTGVATDPNSALQLKIEVILGEMTKIKAQIDSLAEYFGTSMSKQFEENSKNVQEEAKNRKDKARLNEAQGEKGAPDKSKTMQIISSKLNVIADAGVGFIKKTFNLVEMLYAQLKKSSPLLQAIEQLFNLAWTLFFMPIGNKLGEMLIPAVIQLMDDVMDIWDAFDGMSLGEMLEYAITKGVEVLSRFIITIGEQLSDQNGLVGSIGRMLLTVGNFLQKHGEDLLNTLGNVAGFILDHLKEIIALIVAFKAASAALQIQLIIATYAAAMSTWDPLKTATAIAGIAAVTTLIGGIAGGAAYGIMSYADGGYVPATPGGQLSIIGEGGEGEYVIPESRINEMGNHYTNNIYCYDTETMKQFVKDVVSDEISKARLRSGY